MGRRRHVVLEVGETRPPTSSERVGIALVALLFAWLALGIFVWHYVLIAGSPEYAAAVAEGLSVFDSIRYYGIPQVVALATVVLVLARHRWATYVGFAWIAWALLGQLVGLLGGGLASLGMFIPASPVMSGLAILILDGILIWAANFLIALLQRQVLR